MSCNTKCVCRFLKSNVKDQLDFEIKYESFSKEKSMQIFTWKKDECSVGTYSDKQNSKRTLLYLVRRRSKVKRASLKLQTN